MSKSVVIYYQVQDFQDATLDLLRDLFEVRVFPDPDQADPAALAEAEAMFAPMGFACDKARLDACPKLRAVGTPTTGSMHIDVEHAAARGVRVCSLKEEPELLLSISSTAELAWGLVLCLTRHLPEAFDMVLDGRWDGKSLGARTPRMISGLRLGVVGLGRLGRYLAGYGRAFGMDVGYFDPYVDEPEFTRFATPETLAERSDVLSLHVHSTPETRGMVDAALLARLPEGAFLVNTARGDLVDEAALLDALRSGRLAGAALDMLAGEHEPGFAARLAGHPLVEYAREHPNLIITPKYGGSTRDAWELTEARIVERMHQACAEARS